jgi:hypothetical protein
MRWRRLRGIILRLTRQRALAVSGGLLLALPAAWVEFSGRYDAWWLSGISLIALATGVALVWIGVTGASPDWIEPVAGDEDSRQ